MKSVLEQTWWGFESTLYAEINPVVDTKVWSKAHIAINQGIDEVVIDVLHLHVIKDDIKLRIK